MIHEDLERRSDHAERRSDDDRRSDHGDRRSDYGDRRSDYGDRRSDYGDRRSEFGDTRRSARNSSVTGESQRRRETITQMAFSKQDRKLEAKLSRQEFLGESHHILSARQMEKRKKKSNTSFDSSLYFGLLKYLSPAYSTSVMYHRWVNIIILAALISVFLIPYRLAFENESVLSDPSKALDLALNLIFDANVVLQAFHVMPPKVAQLYHDDDTFENSILAGSVRLEIFMHYFSSPKTIIDFLCAIPLEFIVDAATNYTLSKPLRFGLGIFRGLRFYFVLEAFSKAEKDVRMPYYYLRFTKFLLLLSMEAHWFACIFYFVSINESDYQLTWLHYVASTKPGGLPDTPGQLYLVTLYWAATTMATLGYGDITPQNDKEYVVTIVFEVFNLFLSAWVVGNMTLLVTQADESTRQFRGQFHQLEKYMELNMLPDDMRDSMRAYMMLQFNVAKEYRNTLDHFPTVFKSRVLRLLYRPIIDASFVADVASDAFIDSLACLLQLQVLMPGTDAVHQFDASFEMFLIVSGSAEVLLANPMCYDQHEDAVEEEFNSGSVKRLRGFKRTKSSVSLDSSIHMGEPWGSSPVLSVDALNQIDSLSPDGDAFNSSFANGVDRSGHGLNGLKKNAPPRHFILSSLGKGEWFGEVSFLFSFLQPFTIRTTSICRLLVLKRTEWESLKSMYPQDAMLVAKEVERRLRVVVDSFAPHSGGAADSQRDREREVQRHEEKDDDDDDDDVEVSTNVAGLEQLDVLRSTKKGSGEMEGIERSRANTLQLGFVFDDSATCFTSPNSLPPASELQNIQRPETLGGPPQVGEEGGDAAAPNKFGPWEAGEQGALEETKEATSSPQIAAAQEVYESLLDAVRGVMASQEQDKVSELCLAAAAGNTFIMRQITFGGFDVNTSDYDQRAAMHVAAAKGVTVSIEFLLSKGANANCKDCFGVTPLFEAVRSGHEDAALVLWEAGGRLGLTDSKKSLTSSMLKDAGSLMCMVASNADVAYLDRLLRYGLSVNSCDYDGRTGLHLAAAAGHTSVVKCLLKYGAETTPIDNFGRTPLLEAVHAQQEPCARLLFEAGAEFGFLDSMNTKAGIIRTDRGSDSPAALAPIDIGESKEAPEGTFVFDSPFYDSDPFVGAAVKPADSSAGTSPGRVSDILVLGARRGSSSVRPSARRSSFTASAAFQLFEKEVEPQQQQPPSSALLETAPMAQSFTGDETAAAATTTTPPTSSSPPLPSEKLGAEAQSKARLLAGSELCQAAFDRDEAYLRLLLRFGCPPNACDYDFRTAAHICCAEDSLQTALVLLEFEADFASDRVRDRWGRTPLDEADMKNHSELAQVIRTYISALKKSKQVGFVV